MPPESDMLTQAGPSALWAGKQELVGGRAGMEVDGRPPHASGSGGPCLVGLLGRRQHFQPSPSAGLWARTTSPLPVKAQGQPRRMSAGSWGHGSAPHAAGHMVTDHRLVGHWCPGHSFIGYRSLCHRFVGHRSQVPGPSASRISSCPSHLKIFLVVRFKLLYFNESPPLP